MIFLKEKLKISAFLKNEERFNVVSIDWYKLSWAVLYNNAANQVKPVAKAVAKIINFMHAEGMDCSRLILVGHSLGAHIMGVAGYNTKKECKVAYIVGKIVSF